MPIQEHTHTHTHTHILFVSYIYDNDRSYKWQNCSKFIHSTCPGIHQKYTIQLFIHAKPSVKLLCKQHSVYVLSHTVSHFPNLIPTVPPQPLLLLWLLCWLLWWRWEWWWWWRRWLGLCLLHELGGWLMQQVVDLFGIVDLLAHCGQVLGIWLPLLLGRGRVWLGYHDGQWSVLHAVNCLVVKLKCQPLQTEKIRPLQVLMNYIIDKCYILTTTKKKHSNLVSCTPGSQLDKIT